MAFLFHFWKMEWVCYKGNFYPADQPLFSAQHTAIKYGDGVFETIKIFRGKILLNERHFERLFLSLQLLGINDRVLDKDRIEANILLLCEKNGCSDCARVRLTVFRNDSADYLIEAFSLPATENELNSEGWLIGVFPLTRKNTDAFANIKSVNYQTYNLAHLYAQQKGWDEAIVLNAANKIADGSRTNIFLIKDGDLFTPALHQGCVNGVMRQYLIDELKKKGYRTYQTEVSEADLLQAEEVFCSNAIRGIRWVRQFKEKTYGSTTTQQLFRQFFTSMYNL